MLEKTSFSSLSPSHRIQLQQISDLKGFHLSWNRTAPHLFPSLTSIFLRTTINWNPMKQEQEKHCIKTFYQWLCNGVFEKLAKYSLGEFGWSEVEVRNRDRVYRLVRYGLVMLRKRIFSNCNFSYLQEQVYLRGSSPTQIALGISYWSFTTWWLILQDNKLWHRYNNKNNVR